MASSSNAMQPAQAFTLNLPAEMRELVYAKASKIMTTVIILPHPVKLQRQDGTENEIVMITVSTMVLLSKTTLIEYAPHIENAALTLKVDRVVACVESLNFDTLMHKYLDRIDYDSLPNFRATSTPTLFVKLRFIGAFTAEDMAPGFGRWLTYCREHMLQLSKIRFLYEFDEAVTDELLDDLRDIMNDYIRGATEMGAVPLSGPGYQLHQLIKSQCEHDFQSWAGGLSTRGAVAEESESSSEDENDYGVIVGTKRKKGVKATAASRRPRRH